MKKKIRKIGGLLLAAAMTAALFAGCGGSGKNRENTAGTGDTGNSASSGTGNAENDTSSSPGESVGISIMFAGTGYNIEANTESVVAKALEEKTGVAVEKIIIVDTTGGADLSKMQLAFSTGDVPDVVVFAQAQPAHSEMYNRLIQDEQILDLTSYITEETPNLKAMLNNEVYSKLHTNVNRDPIYAVPNGYPMSDGDVAWAEVSATVWAREDWLNTVNVRAEDITTNDGLYQLMKAFKEKIPDVNGKPIIPATLMESGGWWNDLSKELATPWFSYVDGVMYTQHTNERYVDQMAWFGKVYGEKLLDQEAFTHKANIWAEKLTTGRVGITPCTLTKMVDEINPILGETVPGARFVPLYNLIDNRNVGPGGAAESAVWYNTPDISGYTCVVSAAEDKAPAIIKFLDYIAGEEGQLLTNLGVEGETYETVDGYPALKADLYSRYTSAGRTKLMTETGLTIFNLAGYKQSFEITGGENYNWQYENKESDVYKFTNQIVKEVKKGMNPDPSTFVTSLPKFNELVADIYGVITPIQNEALTASSEEAGREAGQRVVDTANEMGMDDFLKEAAKLYKEQTELLK